MVLTLYPRNLSPDPPTFICILMTRLRWKSRKRIDDCLSRFPFSKEPNQPIPLVPL